MVPAVERAIQILRYLAEAGAEGRTLTQIQRALGLNKSTCFYILRTLAEHRFVRYEEGDRRYRLGPELVVLGLKAAEFNPVVLRERVRRLWATVRQEGNFMVPAPFDYVAARSVPEAVQWLARHRGEAKILAGGQSLIPMLRFRLAAPRLLVDINRVPGLDYLLEDRGRLRIGALVRHADIERSPRLRERYPLLWSTARVVADPLVRNLGTVAGSLVHADPAGDWGAAMLAARAEVVATGPEGERAIPIDEFLVDTFATALREDEVVTEVRVPLPSGRSWGTYLKIERKVGDFAVVGVGVQVELDEQGTCREAGIGLCAVGPVSLRARAAEEVLRGSRLTESAMRRAAELAAEAAEPVSDTRGPAEYKRDMVRVLTLRALREIAEALRAAA